MNTKSTPALSLLLFAAAIFLLQPFNSFAQQKQEGQVKAKKTYTIHVTKEVDGNTVVLDTTVVTDGDFDADAFLEEKGVMNDVPEAGKNTEKHIIIRRPGSREFSWNNSDENVPDTIIINDDKSLLFDDKFDRPFPPDSEMPYDFHMPRGFRHMQGPQFEDMLENMARSLGLEDVMPFGEMKQVVVKKKHKGKKVIITFEDREGNNRDRGHGNKKEQKVIIYGNDDQGMAPRNEERVIIEGKPGENVVIHRNVKKTGNGDQVIINAEVDKAVPVKKETRVIIIREDGTK